MKTTKIAYWVLTVLFSAFIIITAIPEILRMPQGADIIVKLGYPAYLVPFLGFGKLLGSIALLIPGFPKIKEWAYAGLFFDLAGATYSFAATGASLSGIIFMLVFVLVLMASYYFYHSMKRRTEQPILEPNLL